MIQSKLRILTVAICLILLSTAAQAVMAPMTQETLVDRADVIVRGYVISTQSVTGHEAGEINTVVDIRVLESIKGQAPEEFSLSVPGGSISGDFYFVTDYPAFEAGQEIVLFLDDGLDKIVGQIQGKATLESGVVMETMLDADDYVKSLKRLAQGIEPAVDPDAHFAPVSSIDSYVRNLREKYAYDGLKWSSHSVRVEINENCNDTTGEGDAVRAAMSSWNGAPADFRFIDDGSHSRTSVEYNGDNEVMWGWGNPGQAIAYTAIWGYNDDTIAECDMLFLNDYDWSAQGNPAYYEMDVQNIATHEFGHYLSLLDMYNNSDSEKTMYGYATQGETKKRSLHQDDINGIVHIYGSGPSTDDDTDDDDSDDDVNDDVDDDDDDDDDDWLPDDDDNWSDDDAWDDDDNAATCSSALSLLYEDCGYDIDAGSGTWSAGEAMEACGEGGDAWDCVLNCSVDDLVSSCSLYVECLQSSCGVVISGDGSGDDDGTGKSCGFSCI